MEDEDFFEDKTKTEEARMTARAVRFERIHYILWPTHCVLVHFSFCVMLVSGVPIINVQLRFVFFHVIFISVWYQSTGAFFRFTELFQFEVPS